MLKIQKLKDKKVLGSLNTALEVKKCQVLQVSHASSATFPPY